MTNTTQNRRHSDRAAINAVVGIDSSDRTDRVGITRNLSRKGALFHSASRFSPGEKLELLMRAPGEADDKKITARVVRTELDAGNEATMFRHLTAVEFDVPLKSA